jgi:RNA polymerase-binding transcription factor DksA
MAGGWTRDGAVQDQIDDTVKDAVLGARARLPAGEGLEHCEECGETISQRRRLALPGVRTCIACQSERDAEARRASAGINRRGSKDSQLR